MSDDADAAAAGVLAERIQTMMNEEIAAGRITPVAAATVLCQALGFLLASKVKPGRLRHALNDVANHIGKFAHAYRAETARDA